MNRSFMGYPEGRDFATPLGFPLGQSADQIPRFPPVADYSGWWDSSDAASLTISSGVISQWNDKSSGGNHLTAVAGVRPAYGTRMINHILVPDFSGDEMTETATVGRPLTFCVIAESDSVVADMTMCAPNANLRFELESANLAHFNGAHNNGNGALVQLNVPFYGALTIDAAGVVGMRLNDTVLSVGGAGSSTTGGLEVGSRPGGAQNWDGVIAELLWFARVLTAAELNSMYSYMSAKWGTQ